MLNKTFFLFQNNPKFPFIKTPSQTTEFHLCNCFDDVAAGLLSEPWHSKYWKNKIGLLKVNRGIYWKNTLSTFGFVNGHRTVHNWASVILLLNKFVT